MCLPMFAFNRVAHKELFNIIQLVVTVSLCNKPKILFIKLPDGKLYQKQVSNISGKHSKATKRLVYQVFQFPINESLN